MDLYITWLLKELNNKVSRSHITSYTLWNVPAARTDVHPLRRVPRTQAGPGLPHLTPGTPTLPWTRWSTCCWAGTAVTGPWSPVPTSPWRNIGTKCVRWSHPVSPAQRCCSRGEHHYYGSHPNCTFIITIRSAEMLADPPPPPSCATPSRPRSTSARLAGPGSAARGQQPSPCQGGSPATPRSRREQFLLPHQWQCRQRCGTQLGSERARNRHEVHHCPARNQVGDSWEQGAISGSCKRPFINVSDAFQR